MPTVDELIDELHGESIFTKLDLRLWYHQVRMVAKYDVFKTTFRIHECHCEFLAIPFGLNNALAMFQSMMNDMLKSFMRHFTLVFFDDILISTSLQQHSEHLKQILQILRS